MAPLAILDSQKKFSALRQQLNILQPQDTCLSSPKPYRHHAYPFTAAHSQPGAHCKQMPSKLACL